MGIAKGVDAVSFRLSWLVCRDEILAFLFLAPVFLWALVVEHFDSEAIDEPGKVMNFFLRAGEKLGFCMDELAEFIEDVVDALRAEKEDLSQETGEYKTV